MNQKVERSTRLNKLPFSVVRQLSLMLDPDNRWEQVIAEIPRYNSDDVIHFRMEGQKPGQSSCQAFLFDWGTQRVRISKLLDLLVKLRLYRAAAYIVEDVLHEKFELPEEPSPRLEELKPQPPVLLSLPPKPDSNNKDDHKLQNISKTHTSHEPKSFSMHYSSAQIGNVESTNSTKEQYVQDSSKYSRNLHAAPGKNINGSNISTINTGIQRTYPSQLSDSLPEKQKEEHHKGDIDSVPRYDRSDSSMGIGHLETIYVRKLQEKPYQITTIPEGNQKGQSEIINERKWSEQQQRLKKSEEYQNAAIEQSDSRAEIPADLQNETPPFSLPFSLLRTITDNFNSDPHLSGGRLLGKGGFGSVYYGELEKGTRLAVKKLEQTDRNVDKQFENELKCLTKYQHEHLLPLFGYSCDGPSNCIVYEYMSNGSLEDRLSCKDGRAPLSVAERLSIAKGTARGINHLHTFDDQPLIHRDIKSANILLDDNMVAKVGDFGIARIGPAANQATSRMTTTVVGTSAYMAPEAQFFRITVKMDTFSYGVILLEILTGLEALDEEREEADLMSYVMEECEENEDIVKLLDKKVDGWQSGLACAICAIAYRCLERNRKHRPHMSEILPQIENLKL